MVMTTSAVRAASLVGCGMTTWAAAVSVSGYKNRTRLAPRVPPISWAQELDLQPNRIAR
jgi:hypothetical protein